MSMIFEENGKDESGLTLELLNQTCLALVSEIEELKKENTRLREKNHALAGLANQAALQIPKP